MLGSIGRFVAAYLAQALSMCIVIALLVPTFGAYRVDQFMSGFIYSFVFLLMIVPLRVIIPFLCVWVVLHTFRYLDLWQFLILGGLCGLFVFMTLPDGDDAIWTFRWRHSGPMKASDWGAAVGLVFSGCIGGWAAGVVGRRPTEVLDDGCR